MQEGNLQKTKRCFPDRLSLFFLIILLALIIGLWRATPDAFGADVYVDTSNTGLEDGSEANPYRSIMAAINDSTWGDVVRVAPGIYFENVVMKDGVDLNGANPETTVIDADGVGSVVETSNDATISGFTIRNGTGGRHWWITRYKQGGGIKCDRKNTTIANNIIEDNYQRWGTSLYGGGIFLWVSTATVRNNVIIGNKSFYGSGIYTYGGSPKIINNTFVNNYYQYYWYSQTIIAVGSPATIENNIFYGNDAGEIWNSGGRASISYNEFWDNRITSNSFYHYPSRTTITTDNEEGDNTVLADPMFVDASSGDYHLLAESPAINTGNPIYLDPDGTRSDIGAFYFPMVMKPNYVLTEKMANHGSVISGFNASDRAIENFNGNAAFNRSIEDADYIKIGEADAVFEGNAILVLDRAVKLESGDYGSELPGSTYLAVILDEYYPVVWVSEDRRSVLISDWAGPESFPEELWGGLTEMALPQIAIEFYQSSAEVQNKGNEGNKGGKGKKE
jgi:hypothetical protein